MGDLMSRPAVVNAISDAAVAARRDLDSMVAALACQRFSLENEKALQAAIHAHLHARGHKVHREVQLFAPNAPDTWPRALGTIDFWSPSGVGIEVKIKGTAADTLRQIERYAESDDVLAILLITAKAMALPPRTTNGKRLTVLSIAQGWL